MKKANYTSYVMLLLSTAVTMFSVVIHLPHRRDKSFVLTKRASHYKCGAVAHFQQLTAKVNQNA